MTSTDLGSAEWERSKISGQDINMLKKMGFSKKENALQFPKEESYPKPPINYRVSFVDHLIRGLSPPIHEFLRGLLFVYGLQLHHLTPNSILHISIFITLCECFLGVQPNWALWKRIFCIRRNSHHNVAYNIGGVVICVRSEVDYFDVKFPDSVQGWRKKWLYIHEESSNPAEENIAPFDGEAKILRRRSWDAEATEAEKLATEALMTRIHELQNTRGKELSGIEITAYFLRTRVQPLQARKNPFWKYAGEEDVDRLSKDLPLKDFEKLIRKISSLNKKDLIPTSCRPPRPFLFLLFLKVEKLRTVPLSTMTTKAPRALPLKSRVLTNPRLLLSQTPLPRHTLFLTLRRGREMKLTSKAEEAEPSYKKAAFNPYTDALVSSDDEEEQTVDATARTSTSRTLIVSEAQHDGDETSPPQQDIVQPPPVESPRASPSKRARIEPSKESIQFPGGSSTPSLDDPLMKEFIRLGTQFVGYRDYTKKLEGDLAETNKRADALAVKLEQSEEARKKAEKDAATIEDLRKRLHDAETSLRRTHQEYEIEGPEGDELLDALETND
ncbi:hypothetical protein QYE76_066816 [Lolium multiflorum]|uniref:Transposase (putative) gypsy type domain-containing protein n=1 Tax=Lolium multiflorum TaxID=4521 RepID=A0AAD8SB93_LOLMU|nr:hypothetical protein QYE76_066816 [Lolium multiflorum]